MYIFFIEHFFLSFRKKLVVKTIAFTAFCLVLYPVSGCTGEPETHPSVIHQATANDTGFVHEPPVFNVIRPDSLKVPVLWIHNSPLFIRTVTSEFTVGIGDTILSGTDPFFLVETQRLQMALGMAEATGDTVAVDSLTALLADSSAVVFITSPMSGVIESQAVQGRTLQPGDTVATVIGSPPDSVYILSPAYHYIMWPKYIEGCRITDQGLQCTGSWPGETATLPGTWSLQQRFIYENDLDSFVITAAEDTVSVAIIGYTDTSKIIYSSFPLDSVALIPW
jgi:hypothetical protein